jgi:hypothetical protein
MIRFGRDSAPEASMAGMDIAGTKCGAAEREEREQ